MEGIQRDLQGLATTEKIDELIHMIKEKDKTIEELKGRVDGIETRTNYSTENVMIWSHTHVTRISGSLVFQSPTMDQIMLKLVLRR